MKLWNIKPYDEKLVECLSSELKISPLVSRLLINRNFSTPDLAHPFLFHSLRDLPNPFLLQDMDKAVTRIIGALENSEKIVVYGDYDVDGTVSSALLIHFFRALGREIDFYVPHRIREGYSLNENALKHLKEKGTSVIITVDNGISAFHEALVAKQLGMDLIMTDHHEVKGGCLPESFATINPKRADCLFPAKEICGAGVAFYLIMALRSRLREQGFFQTRPEPQLKFFLDLVALATVADVVPLVGCNRIFVRAGLDVMRDTQWMGLKALKEVSDVRGSVTATHLGFRLGPRLNACGRLYDAGTGVRLLISQDEKEAKTLALELESANRERQEIEAGIYQQAIQSMESDTNASSRLSHVLFHEEWHPGVIGIVASRLAEKYTRPVILFGRDGNQLKGSGRAGGALNLVEILEECADHLLKFGGHKAAAGLSLLDQNLDNFRLDFEKGVQKRLGVERPHPHLNIDTELTINKLHFNLLDEIAQLEPHGQGNPEPLFCLRDIKPTRPKIIGEKHLKFYLQNPEKLMFEAIGFGMAKELSWLSFPLDCAFSLKLNEYNGHKSLVLNIKDLKQVGN